jgi:hypothetical protein
LIFHVPINGLLWANPRCGNAVANRTAKKAGAIVVKVRRFIVFLPEEKVAPHRRRLAHLLECEW